MVQTTWVTFDEARPQIKKSGAAHGDKGTSIRRYFGPIGTVDIDSDAFRVDVNPGVEHRAHYHKVDQFQIFFGSPETVHMGKKTGPLLVQYTDAHTVYGPFAAGDLPYRYTTLRKQHTSFTGFIPENRDQLELGSKKRHYRTDLREWLNTPLPEAGQAVVAAFQPASADGLAAYSIAAGPGAEIELPKADINGQYQVIVEGSATSDGKELPPYAIGYSDADTGTSKLVAGSEGVRILAVHFGADRDAA